MDLTPDQRLTPLQQRFVVGVLAGTVLVGIQNSNKAYFQ